LIGTTRKTGWVDKGLADGGKYYYRITAVDTTGKESKYLAGTEGGARGRPAIGELAVRSEIGVKRSSFSWSENETDVTGYLIYRSKSPEGPFTQVGESRTSKFSERGFGDGETYYYKVAKKYRSGLQSEQSNAFTASTKPIPSVPEGFAAKSGLARRAVLEWGNPKESDIREFRVYRSDAEDGEYRRIAIVKPGWLTSPGYTDAKLKDNTTYFYKIQAVDRDDLASPMSTPVKATTKPVPAVPRGFVAESGKARSVPLTWNRNDEKDIRSYRIHCAEKEGGPYRTIAETADTSTTHIGLKDKTTYYYKIMAVDRDSLESGFSPVVSATTKPRPRKPTGAAAESGLPRRIELTWNPNPESDIARYTIARREGRIGAFKDVAQRRENAHIDENLGDGKTYQYTIKAVDADGLTSDASESLQATTKSAPAAPRGLTVEPGGGALVLHWNTSPEPDIAGYEIFRSTAWDILGGETIVGQSAAPPFEDRTAKPGKKYIYRIIAVDTTGLRSEKSGKAMASIPSP
jgi:fibronectin type 3 domain-containing protein